MTEKAEDSAPSEKEQSLTRPEVQVGSPRPNLTKHNKKKVKLKIEKFTRSFGGKANAQIFSHFVRRV